MLESKSSCLNLALIIKYHIERVLLSTDTIHLAAVALDLNLSEHPHLIVERQVLGSYRVAVF